MKTPIHLLAAAFLSASAMAQTWTGGNATFNLWDKPDNWTSAFGNSTTTDVIFYQSGAARLTNWIQVNSVLRSLTFNENADADVTINTTSLNNTGRSLTFQAASGNASLNVNADAAGNFLISGNGTANGNVTIGSNLDVIHNGNGSLTINRNILGNFAITKSGSGKLVLSGANTFNGLTINQGTVEATRAGAADLGAAGSTVTLGGGTLLFTKNNSTVTYNDKSIATTASTNSTLVYDEISADARNLAMSGNETIGTTLNGNLLVKAVSQSSGTDLINWMQNITGPGKISFEGNNDLSASNFNDKRLQLGGSNNSGWTGGLDIRKSVVNFTTATSLGTGSVTIGVTDSADPAALSSSVAAGALEIVANDIFVAAAPGFGQRVLRNGSGTSGSGINWTGNLTIGGALEYMGDSTNATADDVISGNITGSQRLTKSGSRTLTLSGNNSGFSGQLWVSGTLVLANSNAAGTGAISTPGNAIIELADGVTLQNSLAANIQGSLKILRLQAGATAASLNGTVTILEESENGFQVDAGANGTLALSGNITGNGTAGLTKTGDGTLVLTGANDYSGNTTVTAGLLHVSAGILGSTVVNVNSGGILRISAPGNRLQTTTDLTLNAGGTFELRKNQQIATLNGAGDIVGSVLAYSLTVGSGNYSGNYSGITGITKTGNGTLTLSGNTSYSGNTTVSGGVLSVSGGSALSNSNILRITSPGVVNLSSNETVGQLFIADLQQAAGNYTSSSHPASFTGSGVLTVLNGAGSGYTNWASTNAGGQTADFDFDGDGLDNGAEYFMGTAGNAFTPNPQPVAGVITWPVAGVSGASAIVEVSSTLSGWQNAATVYPGSVNTTNPAQIQFTLPTGAGKLFARLKVTVTP